MGSKKIERKRERSERGGEREKDRERDGRERRVSCRVSTFNKIVMMLLRKLRSFAIFLVCTKRHKYRE